MIIDDLSQANYYSCLGKYFQDAFIFLSRDDLASLPDGKLVLKDDKLFAIVASYNTQKLAELILVEGHRRYADIQFVVSGSELLAWNPTLHISDKGPYDPENDVWNSYIHKEQLSFVRLSAGRFAILFPWDAHAPQLHDHIPGQVKKIVLKIALD